jgi:uncharacterized protein YecE (DUF72 family)
VAEVRIGTSGWQYRHWSGPFYPKGLPSSRWLAHYAERFDTVELNNPFYRQPSRETFERWREAVPPDFLYAVKLNRYLTHIKRLAVPPESTELAYSTMAGLGRKCGAVLVQLPPRFRFDRERTASFFAAVGPRRMRHALEPRHASWLEADALEVLRREGVALCLVDTPNFPTVDHVTADFVYVRFHGPEERYASNYTDELLRPWAERIGEWRRRGLDVFAYFNNDFPHHAPFNALRLRELVG